MIEWSDATIEAADALDWTAWDKFCDTACRCKLREALRTEGRLRARWEIEALRLARERTT